MVYSAGCTTFVSCKHFVRLFFFLAYYCFTLGSASLLTFSWLLTKKVCGCYILHSSTVHCPCPETQSRVVFQLCVGENGKDEWTEMQTMRAAVIAFTEILLLWLFRTVNLQSLCPIEFSTLETKVGDMVKVWARLDQCKCNMCSTNQQILNAK